MPLLAAQRVCDPQAPCRRGGERCSRCEAIDNLTEEDWYLIRFYRYVDDQYINQTPMGAGKDCPAILTPRLEAYRIALSIHGYPSALWPWLTEWARTLHRLHRLRELDRPSDWMRETAALGITIDGRGKMREEITPADVLPR